MSEQPRRRRRQQIIVEDTSVCSTNNDLEAVSESQIQKKNENLINCPDCGAEISRRAVSCPRCGCPIQQAKYDNIIRFKMPPATNLIYGQAKIFDMDTGEIITRTAYGAIVTIPSEKPRRLGIGGGLFNIKPSKEFCFIANPGIKYALTWGFSMLYGQDAPTRVVCNEVDNYDSE